MRPSNEQLLHTVRDALIRGVSPYVQPGHATAVLESADLALGELIQRESADLKVPREAYAAACEFVRRAQALAVEFGPQVVELPRPPELRVLPRGCTFDVIAHATDGVRQYLADAAVVLARAAAAQDCQRTVRMRTHALLEEMIREDARTTEPLVRPQGGAVRPSFADRARDLGSYFSARLQTQEPVEVKHVHQAGGGFSRCTLLVTLSSGEAAERELVLRIEKPHGNLEGLALPLADEHPVLSVLARNGFPAPAPLWLERDPSILGAHFIVMERMPGQTFGDTQGKASHPITPELLRSFAHRIAELQRFPWQDFRGELKGSLRLNGFTTAHDASAAYLERWRRYWKRSALRPTPTAAILYDWLRRNVPQSEASPVLDHGDLGLHNMLCEGAEITALLDWEVVSLNSHNKALADVREMVLQFVPWETFVGWYREAGGAPLDERELRYFRILRFFLSTIVTANALERSFANSDPPEIEYLHLGIVGRHYYYGRCAQHASLLWQS